MPILLIYTSENVSFSYFLVCIMCSQRSVAFSSAHTCCVYLCLITAVVVWIEFALLIFSNETFVEYHMFCSRAATADKAFFILSPSLSPARTNTHSFAQTFPLKLIRSSVNSICTRYEHICQQHQHHMYMFMLYMGRGQGHRITEKYKSCCIVRERARWLYALHRWR